VTWIAVGGQRFRRTVRHHQCGPERSPAGAREGDVDGDGNALGCGRICRRAGAHHGMRRWRTSRPSSTPTATSSTRGSRPTGPTPA